jgi:hypothetical protein
MGVCFRSPFPGLRDRALLEVDSSDLPALLGEVDGVAAFATSDIERSAPAPAAPSVSTRSSNCGPGESSQGVKPRRYKSR